MSYSVVIVEDRRIHRHFFEHLINRNRSFTQAASFLTAAETLAYFEKESADLVLMDLITSGKTDCFAAAETLKCLSPNTRIILVCGVADAKWRDEARQSCFDSFWFKESEEDLFSVMERTMEGERVFPEALPAVSLGLITNHDLTTREYDVLRLIPCGLSNAEIAKKLGITEETVKFHIKELLKKTGFRSRTQLAAKAEAKGIVAG